MADKKETLSSIEELKDKFAVSDAVFEGVKMERSWKSGKQVPESEFVVAVKGFLEAAMDGTKGAVKG